MDEFRLLPVTTASLGTVWPGLKGEAQMTGMFELFTDSEASYRFRLTAPDGTEMALSRSFPDKPSAVAGIAAVREYAGMGLVTEVARAGLNPW
jgi:uncharacterized protein YegP (UPF0339 family)